MKFQKRMHGAQLRCGIPSCAQLISIFYFAIAAAAAVFSLKSFCFVHLYIFIANRHYYHHHCHHCHHLKICSLCSLKFRICRFVCFFFFRCFYIYFYIYIFARSPYSYIHHLLHPLFVCVLPNYQNKTASQRMCA